MKKRGKRQFWTVFAEWWGGSRYVICGEHDTEKEARAEAKACEMAGGNKHRIVEVRWK